MVDIGVRISGLREAQAVFGKLAEGGAAWQRARIGVSSDSPYQYWIEEGRYRGGRPGRTRAVHHVERAVAAVLPSVPGRIAAALPQGGPAVSAEADKISNDMAGKAREFVTVRRGGLRGSLRANRGQSVRDFR